MILTKRIKYLMLLLWNKLRIVRDNTSYEEYELFCRYNICISDCYYYVVTWEGLTLIDNLVEYGVI